MYRIIGGDGKKYGPVTDATVREWIASGRCVSSTLIQVEGSTQWKQLSQFPEFATALTAAPPPVVILPGLAASVPPPPRRRSNLPLILCISAVFFVVGIGLVGLLAAIAIPNFVLARKQAQTNVCHNHMNALALSFHQYAAIHNDQLPMAATWSDDIKAGLDPEVFKCPAAQSQTCAYAYNKHLAEKKLSDVNPMTVLLFESDAGWNGSGGADQMTSRGHYANRESGISSSTRIFHVIFVDGSFTSIPESGLSALRWEP